MLKRYTDGTPQLTYAWDTPFQGQMTRVENALSKTELLSFDAMGQVLTSRQTTNGTAYDFGYQYNATGGLGQESYPSGRTVSRLLYVPLPSLRGGRRHLECYRLEIFGTSLEEAGRSHFPPTGGGGLSVGVFAVADTHDFDEVIAEVAEDDAVILSAESVERRLDALEALDVAFFGGEESGQGAENLDGDLLWDGAELGLGLLGEGGALSHSSVGY